MQDTRQYATRDEAIQSEIIAPIEAGAVTDARREYDIEAIADAVLEGYEDGYVCRVDEGAFWAIVESHARDD